MLAIVASYLQAILCAVGYSKCVLSYDPLTFLIMASIASQSFSDTL